MNSFTYTSEEKVLDWWNISKSIFEKNVSYKSCRV